MNAIKISTLVLGLAMATAIGCGSSGGNGGTGGATIGGGTGGAGGLAVADAASGAGGSMIDGGKLDANIADVAMGDVSGADSGTSPIDAIQDATQSEAGTTICTGLTPAACDLAIRNAVTTSFAQDVPVTIPPTPDYLTCVAQ